MSRQAGAATGVVYAGGQSDAVSSLFCLPLRSPAPADPASQTFNYGIPSSVHNLNLDGRMCTGHLSLGTVTARAI